MIAFRKRILTSGMECKQLVWFASVVARRLLIHIALLVTILERAVLIGGLVFFVVFRHLTNCFCLTFVSLIEAHCLIWVCSFLTTEHQLSADCIVQEYLCTMSKFILCRLIIFAALNEWCR